MNPIKIVASYTVHFTYILYICIESAVPMLLYTGTVYGKLKDLKLELVIMMKRAPQMFLYPVWSSSCWKKTAPKMRAITCKHDMLCRQVTCPPPSYPLTYHSLDGPDFDRLGILGKGEPAALGQGLQLHSPRRLRMYIHVSEEHC